MTWWRTTTDLGETVTTGDGVVIHGALGELHKQRLKSYWLFESSYTHSEQWALPMPPLSATFRSVGGRWAKVAYWMGEMIEQLMVSENIVHAGALLYLAASCSEISLYSAD